MQIRMWGVRGSIAAPLTNPAVRDKVRAALAEATPADLASPAAIEAYLDRSPHAWTYGGNTSCVEVSFDDVVFVLDAGTGARLLGHDLATSGRGAGGLHFFFTHFHWDHICGFPFFPAIYLPGRRIDVWSGRSDAQRLLAAQMGDAHFPGKWDMHVRSDLHCHQLPEDRATAVAGAEVRIMPLIHPDSAYGYRIDHGGRSVVYLTDTAVTAHMHQVAGAYAEFVAGADVVIVDAMYGFLEVHEKISFGHSTIFNFIDFFRDADIGELVIFHHDPLASDGAVTKLLTDATRYREIIAPQARWTLSAAREGQRWDLPPR